MNKYKVRFFFEKENTRTIEMDGDSEEQVLKHVTGHVGWYIDNNESVAINMNRVTSISIIKLSQAKSSSGR